MLFRASALSFFLLIGTLLSGQSSEAIDYYNKALAMFNVKNYTEAIPLLEQSVNADHNFLAAVQTLGYCFDEMGDAKNAIKHYETAIDLDPNDTKQLYNLARLHNKDGNPDRAIILLERCLKLKSDYKKAADLLAKLKAAKGDTQGATAVAEKAGGDTGKALYESVLALYKSKDYTGAVAAAETAKPDQQSVSLLYIKGVSYQKLKKESQAKTAYLALIAKDEGHADANLNVGLIFFNEKDWANAHKHFLTASKSAPKDPYPGYYLGVTLLNQGKAKEAVPYLKEATIYMPDAGEAKAFLEKALLQAGKDGGMVETSSVTDKNGNKSKMPSHVVDLVNQGVAAYQKKDFTTAVKNLESAHKQYPTDAQITFYCAVSNREQGKVATARQYFEKTLQLDKNYARAYVGLGHIYYDDLAYEDAGGQYSKAIEHGNEEFITYYNLGNCFYHLNNYPRAINNYQKATKLKTNDVDCVFNLGMAHLKSKQVNEALDQFNEVQRLTKTHWSSMYHILLCHIEKAEYDAVLKKGEQFILQNINYGRFYLAIAVAYDRKGMPDEADKYKRMAQQKDPSLKKGM